MSTPVAAVDTMSVEDQAKTVLPFKPNNYAKDEKSVRWVQHNVIPLARHARVERKALEQVWADIRRMVLLQHDQNQRYIGRSKAYVPSYLSARNTLVGQLARGLFPSDDYMDVKARIDGKLMPSAGAKNYIKYEWMKVANIRASMGPFLSQFIDYGITFAKASYYKPLHQKVKARLGKNRDGKVSVEVFKRNEREGLRFSPRSVFFVYAWPTTIDELDDAEMVLEDIDISKLALDRLAATGRWVNTDKVFEVRNSEHDEALRQQQLETAGTSALPSDAPTNSDFGKTITLSEVWTSMELPSSAYENGEVVGTPIPVRIHYIGDTVLNIERNPYWHQSHPYLMHRMRTFPGSLYPMGVGHAARFLQYLINDTANQLNDNGMLLLNPMVKANLNLLQGPLPGFRPGGVIATQDPNSIEFDRPPVEHLQYGQIMMQLWMSTMQETTNAPAVLQGTGSGKGSKTATGTQILQGNALNPLQVMTEDVEASTMVPLMETTIGLGGQFRSDDVLDEIAGEPVAVSMSDIAGDFAYSYLASSQAQSQSQRAQQAIGLLQVLPVVQPLLQQNGKIADPDPIIKRLYNDGFGYRGYEQFIKPYTPPAMPMQEGGAPSPEQQPSPDAISGNAGQTANGAPDALQGEGEQFADVRDNADAISAEAGKQNAPNPFEEAV